MAKPVLLSTFLLKYGKTRIRFQSPLCVLMVIGAALKNSKHRSMEHRDLELVIGLLSCHIKLFLQLCSGVDIYHLDACCGMIGVRQTSGAGSVMLSP